MSDHVVQASEAFRQGASQMPGWLIPATAAEHVALRLRLSDLEARAGAGRS